MTNLGPRPSVTLFSLGGTIASIASGVAGSGVTPQLGASELISVVPAVELVAEIESVTFRRAPSGDLTFADIITLAFEIDKRLW